MRLTPKSFRPPASPSRWRMRSALRRANSGGYPTPLRSGTAARSILGTGAPAEVAGAELVAVEVAEVAHVVGGRAVAGRTFVDGAELDGLGVEGVHLLGAVE